MTMLERVFGTLGAAAVLIVLLGIAFAPAIVSIPSCGSAPKCPCETWVWVESHVVPVPMPVVDAEGDVSVQIRDVRVPAHWKCVERYPLLPEGGCGHLGQEAVVHDAPKPEEK